MSLSIVFPSYNEANKISDDIIKASEFLEENSIEGEVIIVDDGSTDETYRIAEVQKNKFNTPIKMFQHERNLGKGYAVRTGILNAEKEFILYSDVGGVVPLDFALKGIDILKQSNSNIAHGSRKLPKSLITKQQDIDRRIASWIFFNSIKFQFNIPITITDTQCGFKLYHNNTAKHLYRDLKTKGFLFEIEIILRAIQNGFQIIEFPIEWRCDRDSRINFKDTAPSVIGEIRKLKQMFPK